MGASGRAGSEPAWRHQRGGDPRTPRRLSNQWTAGRFGLLRSGGQGHRENDTYRYRFGQELCSRRLSISATITRMGTLRSVLFVCLAFAVGCGPYVHRAGTTPDGRAMYRTRCAWEESAFVD